VWHSGQFLSSFSLELLTHYRIDFSFELQPPGLTTFFLLSQPKTGGDTLYSSQVSNLRKLSPAFVAFLKTLKAVHTGIGTLRASRGTGFERREPIETIHPVVRRHPVTGEEALYVNKQFTRRIVGLKREESGRSPMFFFTWRWDLTIAANRKYSQLPL
jgi:sulfonate dioxygenase